MIELPHLSIYLLSPLLHFYREAILLTPVLPSPEIFENKSSLFLFHSQMRQYGGQEWPHFRNAKY